jgi:hypothetical protein
MKSKTFQESDNNTAGVLGTVEDQDFEDSFTNELGEMSVSSKKYGYSEDGEFTSKGISLRG